MSAKEMEQEKETIPVGKYYNFDNKNVDVVYNPAKDENKGCSCVGALVVHAADTEIDGGHAKILDKTAGEIIAAAKTGYVVLDMYNGIEEGSFVMPLTAVHFNTEDEVLNIIFGFSKGISFTGRASTENDYPVATGGK